MGEKRGINFRVPPDELEFLKEAKRLAAEMGYRLSWHTMLLFGAHVIKILYNHEHGKLKNGEAVINLLFQALKQVSERTGPGARL